MIKSKRKRCDMTTTSSIAKFLIYYYAVINCLADSSSFKSSGSLWSRSQLSQADRLALEMKESLRNKPNASLLTHNPYPIHCPQKENMTKLDIEENNICILRRKWYDELSNITRTDNAGNGRRSAHNLKQFVSQRPYINTNNSADCLAPARKTVRYFPGNCYSKQYEFTVLPASATAAQKKTHETAKTAFENTWWNFAAEVLGDIMYTFDFVLWSSTPSDEYNQFWYLILYLKELATAYENPMDIVGKAYHEAYLNQLKEKLAAVKADLKKRQEDYRVLDHTLKELKITMGSYQNLMSELQNRMGKVVSTLPFEQANQELLLYKLDNASEAASKLELLFRRSNINLPIDADKAAKSDMERSNIRDFPVNLDKDTNLGDSDQESSNRRGFLVNSDKQSYLEGESKSETFNRRELKSNLNREFHSDGESDKESSKIGNFSKNTGKIHHSEWGSDRESSSRREDLPVINSDNAQSDQESSNRKVHPLKIKKEFRSDGKIDRERPNIGEIPMNSNKEHDFQGDSREEKSSRRNLHKETISERGSDLNKERINLKDLPRKLGKELGELSKTSKKATPLKGDLDREISKRRGLLDNKKKEAHLETETDRETNSETEYTSDTDTPH